MYEADPRDRANSPGKIHPRTTETRHKYISRGQLLLIHHKYREGANLLRLTFLCTLITGVIYTYLGVPFTPYTPLYVITGQWLACKLFAWMANRMLDTTHKIKGK